MRSRLPARILLLCALFLGIGIPIARAQTEIFITNDGGNSVTVFPRTATGDPPSRVIVGAATGLSRPKGIAVDMVNNEIVVADFQTDSVTVYGIGANGNAAPLRTISGALTTINQPVGVAVDPVNNEIYVVNGAVSGNITVYPRTANGAVAPLRTFFGLSAPSGISLDLVNNEIAVVNSNPPNGVIVFPRTGGAAVRTIAGPATGLAAPTDVAIDAVNNEIVVANHTGITATVYSRTANGNAAPIRTIGPLGFQPVGLAVDTVNNEILLVSLNNAVIVYSRTANGAAVPLRILGSSFFASTGFIALGAGPAGPAATTTIVASSLNPSTVGASVTFTATVSGSSPTGTVQFRDGVTNLGAPAALSGGSAAFTTSALSQGAHAITAVYSGDAGNAGSTSPVLTQTVNAVGVPPPAPGQPIPTLSQWAIVLLGLLLGSFAIAWLRPRKPAR